MKTYFRYALLMTAFMMTVVFNSHAQRIIKGTVYKDGKPAAGVNVEIHKGGTMMTSFDGKYELQADAKSKYIKFTMLATDESKKLNIEGKTENEIDFYFDDKKPAEVQATNTKGVCLKSREELLTEKNEEYSNDLSLYEQSYRQDDYISALPHWKNIYEKYPKSSINLYKHGITMYNTLIEKANTDVEKEKLLNESLPVYDNRIKYFGEKGYVLGRKAKAYLDFYLNTDKKVDDEKLKKIWKTGNDWLAESIKEQGNATETPVFLLYVQTTVALFKAGETTKEKVFENYEKSVEFLNNIIQKDKDVEKVDVAKQTLAIVDDIFVKSGAADCEALIKFYSQQFEQNSGNIDFIKVMLSRLRKAKCDDSELYSLATEKLYKLDPSPEAAFNMARRFAKNDDIAKAKEYYKQAIEQETDKSRLSDYYNEMSFMVFVKENSLVEARNLAKKSLEYDPKNCQSLMLLAKIYSQANRVYGADAFEKATTFWVAADYMERARAASEECATEAGQKAAEYRRYFPSKEEGFMRTLKEGQSYFVGGWIGENTRVRF